MDTKNNLQIVGPVSHIDHSEYLSTTQNSNNNYYNILNSIIQKSVDYYSSDDEIEPEPEVEEQQISIFEQNVCKQCLCNVCVCEDSPSESPEPESLPSESPEPESLPSESPEPIPLPVTLTIENGVKIKFEREVEQPELIFPNQSNYQYEILEILSDEENVEKPKPKSNFYKYAIASGILGGVAMFTSFSISYLISKRNKKKD
jgi:hypothetical protein